MDTVRYSRWDPATGLWSYYDARDTPPNLNDDLPMPELERASRIGVPSIEAGRPLPPDAVLVGTGDAAVGLIAPVERSRLVERTGPLGGISLTLDWTTFGVGALIGLLIGRALKEAR